MAAKRNSHLPDFGNYIVLNGQFLELASHPTDFSAMINTHAVDSPHCKRSTPLTSDMIRITAADASVCGPLMDEAKQDSIVNPIYLLAGSEEEIIVDHRIILTLQQEDIGELEAIIEAFSLVPEDRMGQAHVLRLTEATGRNALETANEIAQREWVASCHPQVLLDLELHAPS